MAESYLRLLEKIPEHLRQYIIDQYYERYTAQDHAVWRYIMRRNLSFLKEHAHSAYLDGLEKTGISLDKIPRIEEMNENLAKIGWKAVIVDGFLPPAVFMEFQFHKILVISADIRTIQHLLYTPAPDIVHEAAGHAPIIADETYAEFLQKFGAYGMKAFSSKIDIEIYEAIRHLSIIKEYPDTTAQQLKEAEEDLENKIARNTNPSEMTRLSRLHWWTVEYGLVGDINDYKLYGAGLLSSVGESKNCLQPSVKKVPLTIDAANYNYDITKEQPQLFVSKDWNELLLVLEAFADTMSFRTGGIKALQLAIDSGAEATCQYSSGLQVSGIFNRMITSESGEVTYIGTSGPTSLAVNYRVVPNHGTGYHKDGFGSPVGAVKGLSKPLEDFTQQDLDAAGFQKNTKTSLEFESGVRVTGVLNDTKFQNGKLVLLTFKDCNVLGPGGELLFDPHWGVYDMAVGHYIDSVFCGTADKTAHNVYPPKSEKVAIPIKYSEKDKYLHTLYSEVRDIRDKGQTEDHRLKQIYEQIKNDFSDEWLIRLEILELIGANRDKALIDELREDLKRISAQSTEMEDIISSGLELLN